MRKVLLILGIIFVIACIITLLFAVLNLHAYYNLRDGSSEHYNRLHKRAVIFFSVSFVLAVIVAVCIIFYLKTRTCG